jgi:hypothetical protein
LGNIDLQTSLIDIQIFECLDNRLNLQQNDPFRKTSQKKEVLNQNITSSFIFKIVSRYIRQHMLKSGSC